MRPLDAADLMHLAQARDAQAAVVVLIAGDGNGMCDVQVLGGGQDGTVYAAFGDRLVVDIRALLANYGTIVSESRVTGRLDA